MTQRNTYTSGISALMGQQSSLTKKKKPVVWGIPKSNSFPSIGMGNTAQTTNAYPKGVNSPNPTAGNITPSSAAATGTQQGSNAPATTSPGGGSSLPPAGQDYASRLAEITKSANNLQTSFNSYKEDNKKNDGKDSGKNDYLNSLKAEQFPSTFKAEQDSRDKAAERLAKVQSDREAMELEARRAYEETLDAPGGTRAAAQHAAQLVRRRSNTELADVALQENAALRSAQVAQGIFESAQGRDRELTIEEIQILNEGGANLALGSTISQARNSGIFPTSTTESSGQGFSLGENQTRYELDPTTGEYVRVAGGSGTEEGGLGEGEAEKYGTQLDFLINTAMDAMALSEASGVSGIGRFVGDMLVGDTKYRQLQTLTNTLRTNAMSLVGDPDIKKFFGPQMSDADVRLMTAANTSLNPEGQSPTQLYNEANRLLEIFQKLSAAAKEKVTTPEEGELTWETI